MKRFALVLIALFAPLLAVPAQAQLLWQPGVHFEVIDKPVATNVPAGKVEVTEVFSYACPYCFQAQPAVEKLRASLPAYAQLNLVHAAFNPAEDWPMFQRAFLTAQAMGIADANHQAMFEAIWKTGELALIDPATNRPVQPLPTIAAAAKFYAAHAGIKAEDFLARSRAPDIDAAVAKSEQLVKAYGIGGTPAFVVNGKYRTGKGIKTWDELIRVVNYLVTLEHNN